MDNRAVVVAVKKRKAVILVSGGIFREIRNRNYAVGQKINGEPVRGRQTSPVLRRGLLTAACLVLLLVSSALAAAKYVPWVSVTLACGETAVQYRLNALNEVLSASSDTEEGRALLRSLPPASCKPLGAVLEQALSAMQDRQGSDAGLHVEIAPRFGDGRRAEEAVTESVDAHHMEMTLERRPWNEAGQPHERPGRDRQDSVPSVQPEEMPSSVEDIQNAPAEGQQPPVQGQPAYDGHEQDPGMYGQPAFGDGEKDRPAEEQPAQEGEQDLSIKEQPERDRDGQRQPADAQALPANIRVPPGGGQSMPAEGQPPHELSENNPPTDQRRPVNDNRQY